MSESKIIFRCDANSTIGSGHLMRSIALAEACAELGLRPVFATELMNSRDQERLLKRGFTHRPLPKDDTQSQALAELTGDALVVDRYDLPGDYLSPFAQTGRPILQLIDAGKPLSEVSIALNQNLGAQIPERDGLMRLCGLSYALLRKRFRQATAHEVTESVERCLLTLGAADPEGHTLTMIYDLAPLIRARGMTLVVVAGAHNEQLQSLRRRDDLNTWMELHENVTDMAGLMASCQLAVSAAGSTLWELCVMGLPRIVFSIAPNQRPLAEAAAEHGVAWDLGPARGLEPESVRDHVDALIDDVQARQKQAIRGRSLVDGQGALRVAKVLKEAL